MLARKGSCTAVNAVGVQSTNTADRLGLAPQDLSRIFYHAFFEKAMIKSVFLDSASAIIESQRTKKSEIRPPRITAQALQAPKKRKKISKKEEGLETEENIPLDTGTCRIGKHLPKKVPYQSISRHPKMTPHQKNTGAFEIKELGGYKWKRSQTQ